MNKRITSGVIAGIAAICVAVPAAGFADRGGTPHSKKPCKTHRHYGHHKGDKGRRHGMDRGKKCGFPGKGQTGPTGSTSPTGPTGSTGPSGPTGPSGSTTSQTRSHRHGHRH